jgi:adenylate cyclase
MTDRSLPKKLQRQFKVATVEDMWRTILSEGNVYTKHARRFFGTLPRDPRCINCHTPFAGWGGAVARRLRGTRPSTKNPRFCTQCHFVTSEYPGGAEVELTMLFVDVRGSTALAETMDAARFGALMNRFYEATIRVLVRANAFIDKLVGDEVTALFIPGFVGPRHAQAAVEAGRDLLRVTGHGDREGPWVPVGVGIHTGMAWVGSIVGAGGAADFTALGDNPNIAARLASQAGAGEVLVSEATLSAAGLESGDMERRELELKGKSRPVNVRVFTSSAGRSD